MLQIFEQAKQQGGKIAIQSNGQSYTYTALLNSSRYLASKLLHQEPAFRDRKIGRGETPVAVDLQKRLFNFTTNQANAEERNAQIEALIKTLRYFGDEVGI